MEAFSAVLTGAVTIVQEAPQEKSYYDSAPAASLPIQFMTESTVEMEGGHPEPMGAAATEPMPSSTEARPPAQTILQSLQVGCLDCQDLSSHCVGVMILSVLVSALVVCRLQRRISEVCKFESVRREAVQGDEGVWHWCSRARRRRHPRQLLGRRLQWQTGRAALRAAEGATAATHAAGTSAAAAATSVGGAPHVAAGPPAAVPAVTLARDQQVMLLRPFPVLLLCPSKRCPGFTRMLHSLDTLTCAHPQVCVVGPCFHGQHVRLCVSTNAGT